MEIQVINEIRGEVKTFRSLEEFDLYYQKNKESMDKQTTQHLNRLFKIELPDGTTYRITKKNCGSGKGKTLTGDIYLKKMVSPQKEEQPLWEIAVETVKVDLYGKCDTITRELTDLKAKIDKISNTVNILADVVNKMQGYYNSDA